MSNAVGFTRKTSIQRFRICALLLLSLSSLLFVGCSGLVTANNTGGPPPPLAISSVQAGTPTATGFKVSWTTNVAANSAVDYGTTANYGSSTATNGSMVTSHQVALTGLAAGTLYHFRVRSTDVNSNASGPDTTFSTASNTTSAPSITGLNPTSGAVGTAVTITGANFGATQGTSRVTFSGAAATATSWSATSIVAPVPAGAATGNVVVAVGGAASNGAGFTVQADTTPPTVPVGLTATAVSSSQINLSWTASTDNVGVAGYNIFRGGVKIGTAPGTSYQDVGLTAATSYTYNVSAFDAAGNTSAQSAGASATTQTSGGGGGGIPSTLGWYQVPNTMLAPACPAASGPSGSGACKNVIAAWSGAVADTTRNRMILWGGGHTDYDGNEVYVLDLNALTMGRLTNPSVPIDQCVPANADGTANARHTYNGLAYILNQDRMYAFAGSLACASGASGIDTWTFNFVNNTWLRQDPTTGAPPAQSANYQGFGDMADYDPNTSLVYVTDNYNMFTYNYATNTYTNVGNFHYSDYGQTGVIDPSRKLFFAFGNNVAKKMDISVTGGAVTTLAATNCGLMLTLHYPGLAYDPVQKLIVGWAGGDTAYLYNPDTDSCTSVTYPNGPGAQQPNGTMGRFRYFPSLGVFAVVNGWQENAYTLRLTASSGGSAGPTISQITVSGITTTGAILTWTTDVPATTQVEYGTTTAYGTLTTLNSTLATSHSQALAGLTLGTLYHYRVHSKNSSGVESISGDAAFSTNSTIDTTPPTVSMTAPVSGATVSGTVIVSANASDNVGIATVQFTLDGANLGGPVTASPYQVAWDSTTVANGSHSISAVATDTSSNTGVAIPVTASVSNSTNAATAALQDFNKRCTAQGVVYCQSFDTSAGFQQNVNIFANGTYPTVFPTQDTSVMRSGNSSLRIDVPPFQGASPGVFVTSFTGPFAANSDFYYQVATRLSPEMISDSQDATYQWPTFKNFSFYNGNTSCTGMSFVVETDSSKHFPEASQNCGDVGFYTNGGVPPTLLQQGDYNCLYGSASPTTCFYWPTNTWITFYVHIRLNNIDSNGNYPGSTVEAFESINGQPYKQWVKLSNFTVTGNGPGAPWNSTELYPYMTGKNPAIGGYPTAHVWWDELIISTQPIPAPAVPPALP